MQCMMDEFTDLCTGEGRHGYNVAVKLYLKVNGSNPGKRMIAQHSKAYTNSTPMHYYFLRTLRFRASR